MKKLIVNILISILLMSITLAVVWIAPGTYPHDLASLVNKREMLKSKKSPRIIFISGSSQMSLNSPLIEKELRYSVVNMSQWGGLPTREHLKEIKPYLKEGDVVVITMEYGAALDKKFIKYIHTNDEAKKFFFLMSPERHFREYMKNKKYVEAFKIMFELSQMKVMSYLRNVATLNFKHLFDIGFPNYDTEFNKTGEWAKPFKIIRPLDATGCNFTYPELKNFVFLNDFADYAAARKVKTFFYFSHFPEKYYKPNEAYINAYYDSMKKLLKFPILNRPSDFMYPEDYFADTIYHLNEKGEALRSAEILKMLKKAL